MITVIAIGPWKETERVIAGEKVTGIGSFRGEAKGAKRRIGNGEFRKREKRKRK